MASPILNPQFHSYTPRSSGDVQTGEVQHVRGGGRAACIFSGGLSGAVTAAGAGAIRNNGGSYLFYSGAGRLNSIVAKGSVVSGQSVVFYDSAAMALSGVATDGLTSQSGMKEIFIIPASSAFPSLSGVTNFPIFNGLPVNVDMPFQSGLCALCTSGAPGFIISFTPESNILDEGSVVGA